jgi:two-component system NarL family sensor kinase
VLSESREILTAVLSVTILLLLLGVTIIFLVIIFRRKQKEYYYRNLQMREAFKKELLQAQLETQEQTFHSLSQELHDNIGQVLSLAKFNISLLEHEQQHEALIETKSLLNNAIVDLRNISKALNTDYVKDKDLEASIRHELGMLERSRKFEVSFQKLGNAFDLSAERKLILYRIVQESLNNIVKHASATYITVVMLYTADELQLTIEDNGIGFDTHTAANGVGLLNIKHRSGMINSAVNIDSKVGQGTIITIIVKL